MNRLRNLREARGWTLEAVGKRVGLSAAAVSRYETEQRGITAELIEAFSRLYGVSADYLLGLSRVPHNAPLEKAILSAYYAAPDVIKGDVLAILAPYQPGRRVRDHRSGGYAGEAGGCQSIGPAAG